MSDVRRVLRPDILGQKTASIFLPERCLVGRLSKDNKGCGRGSAPEPFAIFSVIGGADENYASMGVGSLHAFGFDHGFCRKSTGRLYSWLR